LLTLFYKKTNIPVLINTSFNNCDEPIVESPEDAIKMFLSTELDYLVI
jgi:carbamoyltransferase